MIKIQDIRKSFRNKKVLQGLSFSVESGSIYGLIGKNGAGKTTLMKILSGLLEADGGNFSFPEGGEDQSGKQQKVSYLPDLPSFYDYLDTDEYLDLLLMGKNPVRRNKLLETVGLQSGLRIKTLSRGMRQRLGIAAALAPDPGILLLDEPTSALDPAGRAEVRDILLRLKKEGKTILLSTHILADMDSICDMAGFLKDGVIAKEVDVKKNREQTNGFLIRFADKPDPALFAGLPGQLSWPDPLTLRVSRSKEDGIASQQAFLQTLAGADQRILSVRSTVKSLDQMFREVCL